MSFNFGSTFVWCLYVSKTSFEKEEIKEGKWKGMVKTLIWFLEKKKSNKRKGPNV
jgi:hypothetical protein